MIPADIDNFIVSKIATSLYDGYIYVSKKIKYIPKEIGNCTLLKNLYLYDSEIVDISPLSNCTLLQYLNLRNNQIVDISPLSNCTSLYNMNLQNNKIIDVSPLYNCALLRCLYIGNNQMVDISLQHGAKVIVQTYPPLRFNPSRHTDHLIREWWKRRQKKVNMKNENLFFSDANLLLATLFDVNQGGEKFYTTWFGKMDSHQSELGNIEIAKTMIPFIFDK